jgi:hypothetical protein
VADHCDARLRPRKQPVLQLLHALVKHVCMQQRGLAEEVRHKHTCVNVLLVLSGCSCVLCQKCSA